MLAGGECAKRRSNHGVRGRNSEGRLNGSLVKERKKVEFGWTPPCPARMLASTLPETLLRTEKTSAEL